MPASAASLAALQRVLTGSRWLGAEIDLSYRVLAVTIELVGTDEVDPRRQVLFSPASTITACLRVMEEPPRVESFTVDQLVDVVAAMDAPVLEGQMVGTAQPTPPRWPVLSLVGRSTAPDGHTHRVLFEAATGHRHLGLYCTFDDVELRTTDGHRVDLP